MAHPVENLRQPSHLFLFSCVLEDSSVVGKAGARYIFENGYNHIANIDEALGRRWSVMRGEAFRMQVEAAGYPCTVFAV